jgi:hypothetical protein
MCNAAERSFWTSPDHRPDLEIEHSAGVQQDRLRDCNRHRHFRVRNDERGLPELQCGSHIFMDTDQGRNLDRDGAPTKAFEPSLFVWAR